MHPTVLEQSPALQMVRACAKCAGKTIIFTRLEGRAFIENCIAAVCARCGYMELYIANVNLFNHHAREGAASNHMKFPEQREWFVVDGDGSFWEGLHR